MKAQVVWDVTPCRLVFTGVSVKRITAIFKVN
jgi:hypothetical protein